MEEAVGRLVRSQHGVISREQLLAAGLGRAAIDRRVAVRRLWPVHSGVYSVPVPLAFAGRAWAAVLACGDDAAVADVAAAYAHGLLDRPPEVISVLCAREVVQAGIETRRCRLEPTEVTHEAGFPVTSVPRTLLDLAARNPQWLAKAINRADYLKVLDVAAMDRLLSLRRGARGVARLRAAMASHSGPRELRSPGEEELFAWVSRHGLELPETNVAIRTPSGAFVVDAYWRRAALVVEYDGLDAHSTRKAVLADRRRDLALRMEGIDVVRLTFELLTPSASHYLAGLIRRRVLNPLS